MHINISAAKIYFSETKTSFWIQLVNVYKTKLRICHSNYFMQNTWIQQNS